MKPEVVVRYVCSKCGLEYLGAHTTQSPLMQVPPDWLMCEIRQAVDCGAQDGRALRGVKNAENEFFCADCATKFAAWILDKEEPPVTANVHRRAFKLESADA